MNIPMSGSMEGSSWRVSKWNPTGLNVGAKVIVVPGFHDALYYTIFMEQRIETWFKWGETSKEDKYGGPNLLTTEINSEGSRFTVEGETVQ